MAPCQKKLISCPEIEGFLHYKFGGLIFRGDYTWKGLFLEFYSPL